MHSALNAAVRLIYGSNRFNHFSDNMRDKLHWLRAGECVDFNLFLLVYKAVQGLIAPNYFAEMCLLVGSVEARNCLTPGAPTGLQAISTY